MTPEEVLTAAAEMIERVGWTQRGFVVEGRVCALGAIALSAPTYDLKEAAKELLRERLAEKYGYAELSPGYVGDGCFFHLKPDGTGYHVISAWNNHPMRTQQEVVDMLKGQG